MCVLLGFFAKNMGDPYYESTIVVHDKKKLNTTRMQFRKGTKK